MKISFQNFKSFRHKQSLPLKRINIVVGKNSVGKSSLAEAISYFNSSIIFDCFASHDNKYLDKYISFSEKIKDYDDNRINTLSNDIYNYKNSFFEAPFIFTNSSRGAYTTQFDKFKTSTVFDSKQIEEYMKFEYPFVNEYPSKISYKDKNGSQNDCEFIGFANDDKKDYIIPHIVLSKDELDNIHESSLINLKEANLEAREKLLKLEKNFDMRIKSLEKRLSEDKIKLSEFEITKMIFEKEHKKERFILNKKIRELKIDIKRNINVSKTLSSNKSKDYWSNLSNDSPVLVPKNITSISKGSVTNNSLNKYIKQIYKMISDEKFSYNYGDRRSRDNTIDGFHVENNNRLKLSSKNLENLVKEIDNLDDGYFNTGKIEGYHNNDMSYFNYTSKNKFFDGLQIAFNNNKRTELDPMDRVMFYRDVDVMWCFKKGSFMFNKNSKLIDGIIDDIFSESINNVNNNFSTYAEDLNNDNKIKRFKRSSDFIRKQLLDKNNLSIDYDHSGSLRFESFYKYVDIARKCVYKENEPSLNHLLPDKHFGSFYYSNKNQEHIKISDLTTNKKCLNKGFIFQDTLIKNSAKKSNYDAKYESPYSGTLFSAGTLGKKYSKGKNPVYINTDDGKAIKEFLSVAGCEHILKYFEPYKLHDGYEKFVLKDINIEDKDLDKIIGINRLKNIYELSNPFKELIIINVLADCLRYKVQKMNEDGLFLSSYDFSKISKGIKNASLKYKITQKAVIHQIKVIERHLLQNLVTGIEMQLRLHLNSCLINLMHSFDYDARFKLPKTYLVTPKTIFEDKQNFTTKELIDWLGPSFEKLVSNENFIHKKNHHGLSDFVGFINSSIKDVFSKNNDEAFEIEIRPIFDVFKSENTFLDLFSVRIREAGKKKYLNISSTGAGNAALISILSQLYDLMHLDFEDFPKETVETILIVREPENYLHPNLCSQLIEYMFTKAMHVNSLKPKRKGAYDIRKDVDLEFSSRPSLEAKIVIETHSEVVLRTIQKLMKNLDLHDQQLAILLNTDFPDYSNLDSSNNIKESLVNVLYIDKNKDSSSISNLGLKSNGFLSKKIPPGFYDINTDLISELWKEKKIDK